jgi:hypothetical protein
VLLDIRQSFTVLTSRAGLQLRKTDCGAFAFVIVLTRRSKFSAKWLEIIFILRKASYAAVTKLSAAIESHAVSSL